METATRIFVLCILSRRYFREIVKPSRIIILKFRTYFRSIVSRLVFNIRLSLWGPWPILYFLLFTQCMYNSPKTFLQLKHKYISHHFIAPRRHNLNSNSGRFPTPPPRTIHLTYKCQTTSKATSTRHYYYTNESCQKGGVPQSMQHYQMLLHRRERKGEQGGEMKTKSPFKKVFLFFGEL